MDVLNRAFAPVLPTNPAKLLVELKGHTTAVTALAFTPDRCLLASASRDGSARVWDVGSSKPGERGVVRRPGETFRAVAFAPNGRKLAVGSGSESGLVWLFDIPEKEKTPQECATLRGGRGAVHALAFSPDGKVVAGAGEDQTIRLWEPGPAFRGDPRTLMLGHAKPVAAAAFAPDGQSIVTASADSTARLWTLSRIRSSQRASLPHLGEVGSLAYTPDGKTLATTCRDGVIRLWDLTAIRPAVRVEIPAPAGGARALIAPDAMTLVGVGDGTRVTNWDLRTGKALREWEVPGGPATAVALTADGRYLARGTPGGPIELYRVAEKRA
jgi:WD40 repeat protein